MYKIYDKWPQIARQAYQKELKSIDFGNIDNIVFSGMGGSGAIADIFSAILSKTDMHVSIVKGYTLPKTVDAETLVVCTSVSGNTVETLNTIEIAKKLDCKLVVFSSGGLAEQIAKKENILYIKIPLVHSPRASFLNYLYLILKVIQSVIPISKNDILESLSELDKLCTKINSKNISSDNPSLEIAEWLNYIPIIYYPNGLQAAAIRFKNSFQENVKSHTMIEDVIEACHNNIVAWEKPSDFSAILLRGKNDYTKTKERFEILKKILHLNNVNFKEVYSTDGSILTKLVCLIYLLDYATIYLAVKNKTDPSPVLSIDFIKQQLDI